MCVQVGAAGGGVCSHQLWPGGPGGDVEIYLPAVSAA